MAFMGLALPLSKKGFVAASSRVNADPVTLWAVVSVETSGRGFLPDRRPQLLFERHIFSKRTGGRFDASHPEISAPRSGGYGKQGSHQHTRLEKAIAIHRRAALESASWGLGQIMGFNSASAGFGSVEEMVAAMMRSEDDQILAMTNFLKSGKMHVALERRDWTAFALAYNGPAFAKNRYDAKLADAHARFSASGLPDLDTRAAQLFLLYHGFDPGPIDGVVGAKTTSAIAAFCARQGNAIPPAVDRDLLRMLKDALPAASDGQADDAETGA
jgi:hypothetical protein